MKYIEYSDHPEIFREHGYPEQIVDLGEIRMNYAVAGAPGSPALLLIPGQTESWWGYEEAMRLLAGRYQVYAVDLRGQGRSTWTPGRYSLDLFGGDLVRFIDRVIGRPVVVSGLSSGGVITAWLSAFAAPGQVRAAVYEDTPLFASEANPAVGPSIRQGSAGALFRLWHKWLGAQWSIGDEDGLQSAMTRDLPSWLFSAMRSAAAARAGELPPLGPPLTLREYDPEWGDAFVSGRVALTCDHEAMLAQVKVPVLFTHHFCYTDKETGNLLGAISDEQVRHVRRLVEVAGNSFTCREFPDMPHSLHGHDPATYVAAVTDWLEHLDTAPRPGAGAARDEARVREGDFADPVTQQPDEVSGKASTDRKGVDGTWQLTIQAPNGPQQVILTLATSGSELTGTVNDTVLESGKAEGESISFTAHLTRPVNVKVSCKAMVAGDVMTGQARVPGVPFRVAFTGKRAEMC